MVEPIQVPRRIETEVKRMLHERVFNDLLHFIELREPKLWGRFRGDDFVEQNLLLALHHDITGRGYQWILRDIGQKESLNHKSFQHNTEEIRRLGAIWATQYIDLPRLEERQELAKLVHQSDLLGLIDLWADSSDFLIQRARGVGTKHEDWSSKENYAAQRYMALQTGDGIVRELIGGYSPKVNDSILLDIRRNDWDSKFFGSRIVANEHFRRGGALFGNVTWVTPLPQTTTEDPENPGQRLSVLTEAQQHWNSQISDIRGNVEGVFGYVKRLFTILDKPWAERKSQQDWVVTLGVGIHNMQKL